MTPAPRPARASAASRCPACSNSARRPRSFAPGSSANPEILDALTRKSAENNGPRNITGLPLYSRGSIIQLLEGDAFDITDLYATISRDDHHFDVERLVYRPITDRLFEGWNMGALACSSHGALNQRRIEQIIELHTMHTDETSLSRATLSILRGFRKQLAAPSADAA